MDCSLTDISYIPLELQDHGMPQEDRIIVCVSGPDSIRTAYGAELRGSGGHVGHHTQDELNVPKTSL
jgi:hypothetical protein